MVADDGAAIFARLEDDRGGKLDVLTDNVKDALLKNIKRRMTPQPLKVRMPYHIPNASGGAFTYTPQTLGFW
jgi:hypothetical protein